MKVREEDRWLPVRQKSIDPKLPIVSVCFS